MESVAQPKHGSNSGERIDASDISPKQIAFMASKIRINTKTGCWEWTGCRVSKTRESYGRLVFGHMPNGHVKMVLAHKLMYAITAGVVPEGYCVLHKCDNPSCVCPKHLMLGTHQENMDDRDRKGRQKSPKGSKSPNAKLTEDQVREIRRIKRQSNPTNKTLGIMFGVCKSTIHRVLTFTSYKNHE